jgi:hypothetical protein
MSFKRIQSDRILFYAQIIRALFLIFLLIYKCNIICMPLNYFLFIFLLLIFKSSALQCYQGYSSDPNDFGELKICASPYSKGCFIYVNHANNITFRGCHEERCSVRVLCKKLLFTRKVTTPSIEFETCNNSFKPATRALDLQFLVERVRFPEVEFFNLSKQKSYKSKPLIKFIWPIIFFDFDPIQIEVSK